MGEKIKPTIVYSDQAAKNLDPLAKPTIGLENKLINNRRDDNSIAGTRPLNRSGLPRASMTNIEGGNVVLQPQQSESVAVLGVAKPGALEQLIKFILKGRI